MTTKPKPTALTKPTAALPAKAPSKSALVVKLLTRTRGATIAELEEPTSWQPHSVRAYLSGLRKRGRTVIREQRKSGEPVYRIVERAATVAAAETSAVNDAAAVDAEPDAAAAAAAATAPGTV